MEKKKTAEKPKKIKPNYSPKSKDFGDIENVAKYWEEVAKIDGADFAKMEEEIMQKNGGLPLSQCERFIVTDFISHDDKHYLRFEFRFSDCSVVFDRFFLPCRKKKFDPIITDNKEHYETIADWLDGEADYYKREVFGHTMALQDERELIYERIKGKAKELRKMSEKVIDK